MLQPPEKRFVMHSTLDAEVEQINDALDLKAPLASPALTGTPTAPTAAVDTSTTQVATTAFVTNQAANATSPMNGTAAVGTSKRYARQDHVHPTDTSRAPLASPALTGTPTAPTAAADTNTTQIATTAYVAGQASSTNPVINGTAAPGTSLKYARADHVHPTDTSRAPTASPTFTGTVTTPLTTAGVVTTTSGGVLGSTAQVPLANGGTNASLTAANGGVVYSNSSALGITAAGASKQVLQSNGAAAPTWAELDLTYMPTAAFKKSVRAATTANITLSAPQTIDTVVLVAGDRVLVKNQSTASQNGIYIVQAAGWTRADDANSAADIGGAVVNINEGSQGGQLWTTSFKTTDTVDTTAMNWFRIQDASRDIPLADGGTNASLTAVNGGVVYSGASAMAITAAGTSGQVLKSNGAAAPTWQTNNLDSLSDVVIGTLEAGQVITYNGTNWINGTSGGGGVTAAATPPGSPVNGSAWFDTNAGTLYVYYDDGNSSQWVQVQANSALEASILERLGGLESQAIAYGRPSYNYVINGAFDINQRGFTSTTTNNSYGFDRWAAFLSAATATYSAQQFVVGTTIGSEQPKNYARLVTSGQTGTTVDTRITQRIEDVRLLASKNITVSFWARSGSGTPSVSVEIAQSFGSGGSPSGAVLGSVATNTTKKIVLSGGTTWTRYSANLSVPSIAGKILGTNNDHFTVVSLWVSAGSDQNTRTDSLGIQSNTFDFWGVQLEEGSVATAFRRNSPNLQAELAACQRYYYRWNAISGVGHYYTATTFYVHVPLPVSMRTSPSSIGFSSAGGFTVFASSTGGVVSAISFSTANNSLIELAVTTGARTAGLPGHLSVGSGHWLEVSAEL